MAGEKVYRNRVYYKRDPKERLMERVLKDANTGCWNWQGKLSIRGYGRFELNGLQTYAHRISYKIFVGPFLKLKMICHHCDNRKCINPKHLYVGDAQTNQDDCKDRNRRPWGENNWNAKLRREDVIKIRKSNKTDLQLGRQYNVSDTTIYSIRMGKSWRRVK